MIELELAHEATAPRSARRWLREQFADPDSDAAGTAELLLTEVVTNVVVHARTASTVRLLATDGLVCVEVQDASPAPLRRRRPDPAEAESGRGLPLVESLASTWGWQRVEGGKIVWFCLSMTAAPALA